MKRDLQSMGALALMKRAVLAVLCAAALMMVAAPARADVCSDAFDGHPCGVTISISGSSGHLIATMSAGSADTAYDGEEDQLVGITNGSTATIGSIVLSGPSGEDPLFAFDNDGPCITLGGSTVCSGHFGYEGPRNTFVGISSDETTGKVLFTTPLCPGQTTWFALENAPTAVVAIGENKPLTAGQTTIFSFGPFKEDPAGTFTEQTGPDDYQVKPLNSASGDKMTVTPIPQPAGPLGSATFGPFPGGAGGFATGQFGAVTPTSTAGPDRFRATNFPGLACVPYKDFSAAASNPVCVGLELDCTGSDSCGFLYQTQIDYNIDALSLPNGVGAPAFLGQHGVPCPTTGFDLNILLTYIGATVDPLKGGSKGTGSCFIAAFDPSGAPIATGNTFSSFVGFGEPVSDTDLNLVKAGQSVPLKWQQFKAPGVPVTNLSLCLDQNGVGCNVKPWVFVGTIKTVCMNDTSPNDDLLDTVAAGASSLQNQGGGKYQYNLKTVKGTTGCFDVVLIYDSGLVVYPANFQYK